MGFHLGPEFLYGFGTAILPAELTYVSIVAGRQRRNASKDAANEAPRRGFDKA